MVEIAYRGTRPDHDFRLEWGRCEPGGPAVARLIDRQGGDAARENFRVTERFDLAGAGCRPEQVTLRLGRVSHATVRIAEETVSVPKPWLDVLASELIGSEVSNEMGAVLDSGETVALGALGSGAGAGGTRAEPPERLPQPR